ncbi:hypothetical protein DOTSEDRAFT_44446 [Dothistroma septosporum NZE10]|uniref:Uncharacterized protein n=1 Tax=Dothistroma septosporum (strain NZE10 / CBS 128990) TaxID=675120 RepID=N1PP76_DOTSN|nr:hypothetical protein DOTSEDRAFT_44446 [Dothistroma septosporum NZE10]
MLTLPFRHLGLVHGKYERPAFVCVGLIATDALLDLCLPHSVHGCSSSRAWTDAAVDDTSDEGDSTISGSGMSA